MEIRVLKYFLTVAKEGSITRAANSLHLTQPTLSRQLMDLEKELGHKLLIRGKSNISFTPEGIILRKRAEEIIDMVEKTEADFSAMNKIIGGDIYIGGGETDSMKYIAEIMKDLQNEYPDIKFHISVVLSLDNKDMKFYSKTTYGAHYLASARKNYSETFPSASALLRAKDCKARYSLSP